MTKHYHYFFSFLFLFISLFIMSACSEVEDKDAFLSSIRLSSGELSPNFHPQTKSYTIAAPYAATSIDITAYPAYAGLESFIDGVNAGSLFLPVNIELEIGLNPDVIVDLSGEGFIPTFYTLTITRADSTGSPEILLLGDAQITHTQGVDYIDAGATALDADDGNITDSIVVDNPIVDTGIIASYTITYNVTNSNGFDAIEVTRIVDVVVNTEPVITLLGNATETINLNSTYNDAGATALDTEEGDLTTEILTVNNVDTSVAGTYIITYDVTDIGGLSAVQVTRTVEVLAF